jgi:hypothetical protein
VNTKLDSWGPYTSGQNVLVDQHRREFTFRHAVVNSDGELVHFEVYDPAHDMRRCVHAHRVRPAVDELQSGEPVAWRKISVGAYVSAKPWRGGYATLNRTADGWVLQVAAADVLDSLHATKRAATEALAKMAVE